MSAAVAAALVLISVSIAEAECAWILWGRPGHLYETTEGTASDGRPKGKFVPARAPYRGPSEPWIEHAYMAAQQCEQAIVQMEAGARAAGVDPTVYKPVTMGDGTRLWVDVMFLCLPDTVDPRGPKGK